MKSMFIKKILRKLLNESKNNFNHIRNFIDFIWDELQVINPISRKYNKTKNYIYKCLLLPFV